MNRKRPMNNTWKTLASTGLVVVFLAGCQTSSPQATPSAEPTPAAAHSDHLTLTQEQAKNAGIEIGQALTGEVSDTLEMVGEFRGYSQGSGHVDTPIEGKVVAVKANAGDQVRQGQVIAVLESTELARLMAEYHHAERKLAVLENTRQDKLQQLREGNDTKGPVEQTRLALQSAHAAEDNAHAELQLQQDSLKRVEALLADGIASEKQAQEARTRKAQAEISYRAAVQETTLATKRYQRELDLYQSGAKVRQTSTELHSEIGLAQEEVKHLGELLEVLGKDLSDDTPDINLKAPQDGTVKKMSVSVGQHLSTGDPVAEIVRGGVVYPVVHIPESQLGEVAVGDHVTIYPGSSVRGLEATLVALAPELDMQSRTLEGRLQLKTPAEALRTGVFLRAEVAADARKALTVPIKAITEFEGEKSVYVSLSPLEFRRQKVEVGVRSGDYLEIVSGLKEGDKVAIDGVFLLKSLEMGTESE